MPVQCRKLVFRRKFRLDNRLSGFETPGDEVRQAVVGLRTENEINGFGPADDFRAFGLGHAAGDRHQHVGALVLPGFLEALDPAKFRIDFFGRMFADVAGIENHQVGLVGNRRFRIAHGLQRIAHALAVIDIHLAAIGFDVNRLLWGGHGPRASPFCRGREANARDPA